MQGRGCKPNFQSAFMFVFFQWHRYMRVNTFSTSTSSAKGKPQRATCPPTLHSSALVFRRAHSSGQSCPPPSRRTPRILFPSSFLSTVEHAGKGEHAPSEFADWNATCWHRYVAQLAVFPPPVSVLIACRPWQRSHSASGRQAFSMLFRTHSAFVPELSVSRYLCTSKTRPVKEPSGFLTAESAAAEP
jgi:hypothetical protein